MSFHNLLSRCYAAENGERVAAHGAQPQPDAGEKEMRMRAVDDAIDLVARHRLGAVDVAVAKQRYAVAVEGDNAVNHEVMTRICQHDIVFAKILWSNRTQRHLCAADEERQHTLPLDCHLDG